jgi:DNA primase catalytic core
VKDAADILDLVRAYVDLSPSGPGNYKGLCPFHAEKTPSFTVNSSERFYYCFGCHAGGDVISFQQKISGMTFPEAVRELARRYGVALPESETGDFDRGSERKARLYEAMERASEFFEACLWENGGIPVRNYLRKRGVSDQIIRDFRLGLSPPAWDMLSGYLLREGADEGTLREAGLSKVRESGGLYDVFRGRLMIPVTDPEGRAVAFAGRRLDLPGFDMDRDRDPGSKAYEAPKYINSPATPIYTKGRQLYGLTQAAPFISAAGLVFVTEGYFDLIAMHASGLRYSVAVMGTAFTQVQAGLLRRLSPEEVYLLFDGDRAGREAARKALPRLLNAGLEGRAVILPDDHDPDTFLRDGTKGGPEALLALAESSPSAFDYTVSRLLTDRGEGLSGEVQAISDIREMLSEVTDKGGAQLLRNHLAKALGIDPQTINVPTRAELALRPRRPEPEEASEREGDEEKRDFLDGPDGPELRTGQPGQAGQPEKPGRSAKDEDIDWFTVSDGEGVRTQGDPEVFRKVLGQPLDNSSMNLLLHVIRHPETAGALDRLEGFWPGPREEALASELSAQARALGSIECSRLSSKWTRGPLAGELARCVASGRSMAPQDAWNAANEQAAWLLISAKEAGLKDNKALMNKALRDKEEGNPEADAAYRALFAARSAINSEIAALHAEIDFINQSPGQSPGTGSGFSPGNA